MSQAFSRGHHFTAEINSAAFGISWFLIRSDTEASSPNKKK